ncbi:hypothetical protein IU433_14250 [Nocardia puris]|uniref:hypothetical protein n=1 Tax=Nocardia puris TaxID=208602 RepID=UPI0018933B5E|nr:hypothetical protein [Nocardia puris]MBF6460199.1 hypothetical protein [Nocardia puris]
MTPDEILILLQVAQSYDARNIDRLMQSAWLDAANRARWDRDAALNAIRAHYAESTERIMPGHVTALVRSARPAPGYAPAYRPALPAAPPASPETRARAMAMFGRRARTQEPRTGLSWRRRRASAEPEVSGGGSEPMRAFSGDAGRLLDGLREKGGM